MAWIRLLAATNYQEQGKTRTAYRGDWLEVSGPRARRMVADGVAEFAVPKALDRDFSDSLVRVVTPDESAVISQDALQATLPGIQLQIADLGDPLTLDHPRVLFWDSDTPLRTELIGVGFSLLDTWEVVAPVASYETLAIQIGSPDERARTAALIGDLRVPVYQTDLVWMRKSRATESLVQAWDAERGSGNDPQLAFLRALWQVKPLFLPVPTTWVA